MEKLVRTVFRACTVSAILLLSGCAPAATPFPTAVASTSTPSPLPPTSTPESVLLQLAFDGNNCVYDGPTEMTATAAEVVFTNNSGGTGAMNFLRHAQGRSIQDALDYFGQMPSTKHHPDWTEEMGTWRYFAPGESATVWQGDLGPGTYHMVCASIGKYHDLVGVYWGTGLTVKD